MKHNFFDRIQQTTTSWLVKGIFIFIVALLFILPLYDLFTGYMAYKIWTMLIISTLLLLYEYLLIYLTGKWDETKQLMKVPTICFVCIIIVFLACCVAFYLDVFMTSVLHPYLIPILIAFLGIVTTIIYYSHTKSKNFSSFL